MKKLVVFLGVVLTLFVFSCKSEVQEGAKIVTPEEMQSLIEQEDVQLVDVRMSGLTINGTMYCNDVMQNYFY